MADRPARRIVRANPVAPPRRSDDDRHDDYDRPAARGDHPGWPLPLLGLAAVVCVGAVGMAGFLVIRQQRMVQAEQARAELAAVEADRQSSMAPGETNRAALPKAAPTAPVRLFDDAAVKEVEKAFEANPIAARRKYAGVRWKLVNRLGVQSFAGDIPGFSSDWGHVSVDFRDRRDFVRLRQGVSITVEVTISDFRAPLMGGDVHFTDVVLLD